ncbi:hypothetical protein RHOSPDRAFT_33997 [Rhodotorula sp. JG-1b]|nr:hypothetical protein RHOSPDRAFT_33997 [Rhodotorula sp. JG-1b]
MPFHEGEGASRVDKRHLDKDKGKGKETESAADDAMKRGRIRTEEEQCRGASAPSTRECRHRARQADQEAVVMIDPGPDLIKDARFLSRNLLFGFKTLGLARGRMGGLSHNAEIMCRSFDAAVKWMGAGAGVIGNRMGVLLGGVIEIPVQNHQLLVVAGPASRILSMAVNIFAMPDGREQDRLCPRVKPVVVILIDREKLSGTSMDGLTRVLELSASCFEVEDDQKTVDHFRSLAEPVPTALIHGTAKQSSRTAGPRSWRQLSTSSTTHPPQIADVVVSVGLRLKNLKTSIFTRSRRPRRVPFTPSGRCGSSPAASDGELDFPQAPPLFACPIRRTRSNLRGVPRVRSLKEAAAVVEISTTGPHQEEHVDPIFQVVGAYTPGRGYPGDGLAAGDSRPVHRHRGGAVTPEHKSAALHLSAKQILLATEHRVHHFFLLATERRET